jgi:preprotein translocase subunit YajC
MFWIFFTILITIVANLIIIYFMIVKPLKMENKSLKEEMHQQIKIGFYNESEELKQDEYE